MIFSGTWIVLASVAATLIIFALGWYWAWSHGQFDDVEAAKHSMLENERRYRDEEFLGRTTHD